MKKNFSLPGQGLVEYVLIILLIAIAVMLAVKASGINLTAVYCNIIKGSGGNSGTCSSSLFSDDFNNLNNWKIISGNWAVKNGHLCGGPNEGRIFANVNSTGNYVINLNGATLSKGNGYGLYFNSSNYSAVNGYDFQYDPGYGSGAYLLREWYQGNELSPSATVYAPKGYNWNQSHNIQMIVSNNTYTAYVDGTKVYQAADSTYPSGSGIGLRTWDSTQVCFDSISVNPLP